MTHYAFNLTMCNSKQINVHVKQFILNFVLTHVNVMSSLQLLMSGDQIKGGVGHPQLAAIPLSARPADWQILLVVEEGQVGERIMDYAPWPGALTSPAIRLWNSKGTNGSSGNANLEIPSG